MGPRSALLLLGALNGAFLALLILRNAYNRTANRLLAALLVLVALRLGIYVLGFAGAYDAYRWLTFVPLDLSAGFAPLLWLYVRALAGRMPRRWPVHLLPAAIQFGYQAVCFLLPVGRKWDWYTTGNLHIVEPVAMAAILVASSVYLALSWRDQARYQAWLDTRFADRDVWRLVWLRTMIAAFTVLLALVAAAAAWHVLVRPLDYFDRTSVMIGFCLLAYALGLLGWRNGGIAYPPIAEIGDAASARRSDYPAQAEKWVRRIEAEGWWREEGLMLSEVARRLGTSERSLSRALNDGAGRNFNGVINSMRVAAVQQALSDPVETRDLLTLALDNGFASKASFNRAFRSVVGTTPSAWRLGNGQEAI